MYISIACCKCKGACNTITSFSLFCFSREKRKGKDVVKRKSTTPSLQVLRKHQRKGILPNIQLVAQTKNKNDKTYINHYYRRKQIEAKLHITCRYLTCLNNILFFLLPLHDIIRKKFVYQYNNFSNILHILHSVFDIKKPASQQNDKKCTNIKKKYFHSPVITITI